MSFSLAPRDPFADAKETLSSWDKCMEKTYCKWPVIVAIIVGSLIILSVVLCVARCICCGAELACCCFKCCTCCCPSSSRGHKRVKSDPNAGYGAPNAGYGAPNAGYGAPNAGYGAPTPYAAAHAAAPPPPPVDNRPVNQQYRAHATPAFSQEPERPQFATFDTPAKPVNEDALPPMPSWNESRSVHVEEEVIPEKRGDMEMARLDQNGSTNGPVMAAAAVGTRRSPGPGRSPIERSPTQDSYGFPPGYQNQNDSFVSAAPQRSPHNSPGPYGRPYGQQQDDFRRGSPAQPYGQPQDDYRRGSPAQSYGQQQNGRSPVYGAGGGYANEQPYGHQSPRQDYNQYDQYSQPTRSPPPSYGYGASNAPVDNFAPGPRSNTPGYASATPLGTQNSGYTQSESTRYEPSNASYPGQQSYEATGSAYPGQQSYQAFNPGQTSPQYSGVTRKPVDGSWKEI